MSDPQRLLDGDATKNELELLGSWKHEEPSPGARKAALGLVAASVTSVAAASAATGTSGVFKAMLIGTLCVLATLGVVGVASSRSPAPLAPSSLAIVAPAPALPPDEARPAANDAPLANGTRAALEPGEPPSSAPPAPNDDPTNEPGASPGDPVAVARAPAPPAPRSDLAAEIAAIDAARTALASGNAAQALARLDAHDAAFRRGALAQEAMLLRVEALARLGRRREAAALGRAFLGVHPTSTLAARVRAAVPELRGEAEAPH